MQLVSNAGLWDFAACQNVVREANSIHRFGHLVSVSRSAEVDTTVVARGCLPGMAATAPRLAYRYWERRMDGIRTIEHKFRRTPVRLIDHEGVNGVLRLRGRKSLLELSSDDLFHPPRDDADGWFDLIVRAQDGRDLLLHHAINAGSGTHHWGDERDAHYARVYPNIVVDDVRGLSADRQVQRVSFRRESCRSQAPTSSSKTVLRSSPYRTSE